jgi:hypothetical protein
VRLLRRAPLALLAFGRGRDDHSGSGPHTFRQPLRSSDTFQVQASLRLGRRRKTPKGEPGPHHSGGGASGVLQALAGQIREQVAAYCESTNVAGYVAGVYHDGAQTVAAYGLANVVTGAPMGKDTGFLLDRSRKS